MVWLIRSSYKSVSPVGIIHGKLALFVRVPRTLIECDNYTDIDSTGFYASNLICFFFLCCDIKSSDYLVSICILKNQDIKFNEILTDI
jgi:hypothetical protein